MNIKLTNTDYFFIFSVLLLYIYIEISKLQEPLFQKSKKDKKKEKKEKEKEKQKKLEKKEEKGNLTFEQKLTLHKQRSERDFCAAQKERDRIAEEDAVNKIRLDNEMREYQKQHDQRDRINRFTTLPKLNPHTVLSLNVDAPKFEKGELGQWNELGKYNKQKENERRERKLPFDHSSDWKYSPVENTQRQIAWYPYAGKNDGPITVNGRQDNTYNDRLRNSNDAEMEDVVVKKWLANRDLAKPIWSDVVDLFPMDLRNWEREEPGPFDPTLYMSKKERKQQKKQEKKAKKQQKKEEKRKRKSGKGKKEEEPRKTNNWLTADYWRNLLNIE